MKSGLRFGTNCFRSRREAERYYGQMGFNRAAVAEKIRIGEIRIDRPAISPGETFGWDDDGRAHVYLARLNNHAH